jgi:hypothetical protein
MVVGKEKAIIQIRWFYVSTNSKFNEKNFAW